MVKRAILETANDRYQILDHLADGGMGTIFFGKKHGTDGFEKDVVIKQLLPEFVRQPEFIELFVREARLSASLDHPNIVHTLDLVQADDDYFIVMEYVRGGDLRTLMKRAKRRRTWFPAEVGLYIAYHLLDALAYAYNRPAPDGTPIRLIHRDISPSNILLSSHGEVKLTDFGIAKAATQSSVFFKVKGKVGYMAPEQARGEPVDARADLFSVAVVLYEVLVGERLFVGDLLSSPSMIYSQPVTPPSQKQPGIPPELDPVILRALSLDPSERFQSASEFREALGRAAQKARLLPSAAHVADVLRDVCGEDTGNWIRPEEFPSEPTTTGVMSTVDEDEGVDHQFDGSEGEPLHDNMPKPSAPAASDFDRPPSFSAVMTSLFVPDKPTFDGPTDKSSPPAFEATPPSLPGTPPPVTRSETITPSRSPRWLFIVLILIGLSIAVAIAMSGPSTEAVDPGPSSTVK